jgi:hypothetical protein
MRLQGSGHAGASRKQCRRMREAQPAWNALPRRVAGWRGGSGAGASPAGHSAAQTHPLGRRVLVRLRLLDACEARRGREASAGGRRLRSAGRRRPARLVKPSVLQFVRPHRSCAPCSTGCATCGSWTWPSRRRWHANGGGAAVKGRFWRMCRSLPLASRAPAWTSLQERGAGSTRTRTLLLEGSPFSVSSNPCFHS